MVATALTLAAACRGSSAAADIPTGKPREAPSPQRTVPRIATGTLSMKITMLSPTTPIRAETRSTGTRPNRSRTLTPAIRPTVIAVTKMPNTTAPVALVVPRSSTIARASQSPALPSANAMPSTISPISRVVGCFHTDSRSRQPCSGSASSVASSVPRSSWILGSAHTNAPNPTATIRPRCQATGRWMRSISAPMPAPAMVPKEKNAWNNGMIVRPARRSFAAPERFIATSLLLIPTPKMMSPNRISQ